MHELGVVFHIIDKVEAVAAENKIDKVQRVTLELGEVSGVIESYLSDCWRWAIKRTKVLTDAELSVETIPAVTFCEGCQKTYSTTAHGKICPHCKSENTYLLRGNEFNLKEIEVIS